ncbi:serine hydrolase [Pedobacter sp. KR3-3]|uniref:beta-lactamase n=1 Tax=Pedobacter albus TaxID=3113905 RepID=A0ABU7I9H1_9SPHI|nr:serine hydrolase [Pedobacter sp. KR3-3]MEE1946125.1 serine hydrolase [Pedobacter sp. KR3-3]
MNKWLLSYMFLLVGLTAQAQNLDELVSFIKQNPKKASIYLIEGGQTTINLNSSQVMPLASAAKTIIAITFAKQVAAKKISPTTKVAVQDLAKYYIPNTDGQAHPNWLKSIGKSAADSVTLLQVAKGMIKFSSNANTEYLQDLLGLATINKTLATLQFKSHQPLYYFTAGATMATLRPEGKNNEEWIKELSVLSLAAYAKKCEEAHQRLKTDPDYIKQFSFARLPLSVQKVWSDRLVGSTTYDYAQLMQKILDGKFFEPKVQSVLESIMEWPMAYSGNQAMFNHLGQKGGSTAFVLTDAFYASAKNGTKIACAFFFNNLDAKENAMVNKHFGDFEASILTDADFRKKLVTALR